MRSRSFAAVGLLAGGLVLASCHLHFSSGGAPFSYAIDPSIAPRDPELGALVGPGRDRVEFALDEVVVHPESRAALDRFVARYHGTIVSDGSRPRTLDDGSSAPATGYYLIHVDPATLPLDHLTAAGRAAGLHGRARLSSERAARLAALVADEKPGLDLGFDVAMHGNDFPHTTHVYENPDGAGGNVDFATKPYMVMSNVIRAWDYLSYKGIPFGDQPWIAPVIAIVDGGFALDSTGQPIGGNADFYMSRVRELNEVDLPGEDRHLAGGTNPGRCGTDDACPWHGTGVFSVAAAFPYNKYGAAGTSKEIAKVILIRATASKMFEVAKGVSDAALMHASVINLSLGTGPCGELCGYFADTSFTDFQANVNFARGYELAVVVAAAGNSNEDNEDRLDNVPCTLDGVLCVGAVDTTGAAESYSGAGGRVAIWAPDCIDTTPIPDASGNLGTSLEQFCGTSASAPFVSGIVAMMKALNPTALSYDQAVAVLQATAARSTDPKVKPGFVDALAAVQRVSPNQAPTIRITSHTDGAKVTIGQPENFIAAIGDPEQGAAVRGETVTWTSDRQGFLCKTNNCDAALTSLGFHHVTAKIVDAWGAVAVHTITLEVTAGPAPTATITWPANNATFSASQRVELRGNGYATTEPAIPDARLAWTSSRDGALGTGGVLLATLSVGTHVITLTSTDRFGQTGRASITVQVTAATDVPTVQITQPPDYTGIPLNTVTDLVGSATDPVDGTLSGAQLVWTSDVDGVLGTGGHIRVVLSGPRCGPGFHNITLRATNRAGRSATTLVRIAVGPVC